MLGNTSVENPQSFWEPFDARRQNTFTENEYSRTMNKQISIEEDEDGAESVKSDEDDGSVIDQLDGELDREVDFAQDLSEYDHFSQIQMEIENRIQQRKRAFESEQISFYENQNNRKASLQDEHETVPDIDDSIQNRLDTFASKLTAIRLGFTGTEKAFQQLASCLYNLFLDDFNDGALSMEDINARKKLIKSEYIREKRIQNQYKVPKSTAIDCEINGEKRNFFYYPIKSVLNRILNFDEFKNEIEKAEKGNEI